MTETVRGQIDTAALGSVLMHEHIFVLSADHEQNYPGRWHEEERIADAITKLQQLKSRGVDTIVDLTVLGMGRSIPRIQRLNESVDINIVVATGLYTYDDVPFEFRHVGPGLLFSEPEPLVDIFVHDIRTGIADTGVRAGMLKCAIDEKGLTPGVERVIRAVAQAHVETGTPITVHTHPGNDSAVLALKVLVEEGVDLTRVVVGHAGSCTDVDYLARLADTGSVLGMDQFGFDTILPLQDRIDTVVELVDRGYIDRMVLSHDTCCYLDWFPSQQRREQVLPNWKYTFISDTVLPALRRRGVTDEQIHTMLVDNPRRILESD